MPYLDLAMHCIIIIIFQWFTEKIWLLIRISLNCLLWSFFTQRKQEILKKKKAGNWIWYTISWLRIIIMYNITKCWRLLLWTIYDSYDNYAFRYECYWMELSSIKEIVIFIVFAINKEIMTSVIETVVGGGSRGDSQHTLLKIKG